MTFAEQWVLEERAEQLAIVHLTRRDDLIVMPAKADYGIDLLVTIAPTGVRTGRIFGVQVRGYGSLPIVTNGELDTYTFDLPSISTPTLDELPFPLCSFLFAMDTDLGYYRWLVEPVATAAQSPILKINTDVYFTRLTKDTLDRLVSQVNAWYDAKHRP